MCVLIRFLGFGLRLLSGGEQKGGGGGWGEGGCNKNVLTWIFKKFGYGEKDLFSGVLSTFFKLKTGCLM